MAAGVGREVRAARGWRCRSRCSCRSSTRSCTRRATRCWCAAARCSGRRFDITLEATAAGALAGIRVVVIIVALWLMSVAVDPDALLRLFRRVSYRSALTASLATRLVPVLARDARA